MPSFKIKQDLQPAGDQPQAIEKLVAGIKKGMQKQTLLGVTGSGKTFTAANVIQQIGKPTLVIAHNKTLAAQLCNEFRELFPENAVHYFVSYYDYYQPEAYIPRTDTYIEKEALINQEIDRLRHAATTALLTRKDVIIVASVSCIYGLGAPEAYEKNIMRFKVGDTMDRTTLTAKLIQLQYSRTNADLLRGTFRLKGDIWEIMPPDTETIYNFELIDGKIQTILGIDPVEGFVAGKTPKLQEVIIAPAKHFVTQVEDRERALVEIQAELKAQLKYFDEKKLFLEAERIERRTKFDLAMMREVGYCHGIENYSRILSGREAGAPPDTLLSYFPRAKDGTPEFLTIIDESHITIPQISGMHGGDRSRKETLVEYGFRLPSAKDNRPLTLKEFQERVGQTIFVSATPGESEIKESEQVVEQIIRPTGLIDPKIIFKPAKGQVQDLVATIKERLGPEVKDKARIMVTTLTKKMAEDLTEYLKEAKVLVAYVHSDVKTLDRIQILTDFRRGKYDVLVGVNLLREGLDLPEVSLVAILDADKEGFLRSETSLIQTIGRAARNVDGTVILYADNITGSITRAVGETDRRRAIQVAYNKEHNITPRTIIKTIHDILPDKILALELGVVPKELTAVRKLIKEKEREMKTAGKELDFELAAILRDEIKLLAKEEEKLAKESEKKAAKKMRGE